VVYPEYLTDDSRLTLANARSAADTGQCGDLCGCRRGDPRRRSSPRGGRPWALPGEAEGARINARIVVNAAGPWVDAVRRLEDRGAADRLQLTKASTWSFAASAYPSAGPSS